MTRVSVVIPTWNGGDLLAAALASLHTQTFTNFETVVVDNGSTDCTGEVLRGFPEVRVVRFATNRGFAAAVNAGIEAAAGEFVVLMNNDTEAEPGWLEALVCAMDDDPALGSCASKMLIHADPTRIDSAGDQLGLFASTIGHGAADGPAFARAREVLSACAGAAAYRRRALDEVGLFDESFFAYFEDVDIGIRLRLAGWRCRYVPDAVIRHHGSATARRLPSRKFRLTMCNSLRIFFQYMPPGRLVVWGPAVLAWPLVRAVIDRRSPADAATSIVGFLKALPAVLRRRSTALGSRRITQREFTRLLAPVWTRQTHHPVPKSAATARTAGAGA